MSLPVQVEVKANRTAVVGFKPDATESIPVTIPYQFSGETVSLQQGYLIWLPFTLPQTKVRNFPPKLSCDQYMLPAASGPGKA